MFARWFALIFTVLAGFSASANELELIYYRAPRPLDWTTPGSLVRTTVSNMMVDYPHSISHVNVKLQCEKEAAIYRGSKATKSTLSYAWDLIAESQSMESMIIPVPGTFYENEEILSWLPYLKENGYVRSLKLVLSDEQCVRAKTYLTQFVDQGQNQIYGGLRSNPRLGQGAGCAAFAVSFLEVLGAVKPEFKSSWQRHLRVPLVLTSTAKRTAAETFVTFMRGRDYGWAAPKEAAFEVDFWDPELSYDWIGDVAAGRAKFSEPVKVVKQGKFQSVVWDVSAQAIPQEPIFPMGFKKTKQNTQSLLQRMGSWLSDGELMDPLYHECGRFKYCDRAAAVWK